MAKRKKDNSGPAAVLVYDPDKYTVPGRKTPTSFTDYLDDGELKALSCLLACRPADRELLTRLATLLKRDNSQLSRDAFVAFTSMSERRLSREEADVQKPRA